jgi:Fur family zinc uptake transcriptional regulator
MGCARPDEPHASQFLICAGCGITAELDESAITAAVLRRADKLGFAVEEQTVEVRGFCSRCRRGAARTS